MRMILQRRRKVDKWESKNCFIFQRLCEDTTHRGHNNEHGNRVQINYCKISRSIFGTKASRFLLELNDCTKN
jgi:hypothetical protein